MKNKYLSPWYFERSRLLGEVWRRKILGVNTNRVFIYVCKLDEKEHYSAILPDKYPYPFDPSLESCKSKADEQLLAAGFEFLDWDRFRKLELLT